LNGLWEYSITPIAAAEPNKYYGHILVPFPIESSLSGVGKVFHDSQALWYKRQFTAPAIGANELLILNLGAVDYYSHVFINGHSIGEHKGGFSAFSFDITKFLDHNIKEQVIVVKVTDATGGAQPNGKQVPGSGGNYK
jgi:beta-galactosidase/beta-glucuronidase